MSVAVIAVPTHLRDKQEIQRRKLDDDELIHTIYHRKAKQLPIEASRI